eukprot:TRINITY_DN92642_c0_g1_i1.p1 TRINITY_DN92642_c0_g1~~TRINITY_DN92642_c0_g1_i1.p1  ORF type:complete len:818 (-),score=92.73 TRINITY_DN92642_c0_g1_i1:47-2500(-)
MASPPGTLEAPLLTAAEAETSWASRLERYLGTDLQRAMACLILAGVSQVCMSLIPVFKQLEQDVALSVSIHDASLLFSAVLMLVGNAFFYYGSSPDILLIASFYDDGQSQEIPCNPFKRHFGTRLLLGANIQVLSQVVLMPAGLLELLFPGRSSRQHSSAVDGWDDLLTGGISALAYFYLARTCYPETMMRPDSDIGNLLDMPCVKSRLGEQRAHRVKKHVGNDLAFQGWLAAVAGCLQVAFDVIGNAAAAELVNSVGQAAGGLFLLRFGYNQGTLLDPVLFGCYRTDPLPPRHPMGDQFNAQSHGVDVLDGVRSAYQLLRLPWAQSKSGAFQIWEGDGTAAFLVDIHIDMNAFVLASLLRSKEAKEEEANVCSVSVVDSLPHDAEVLYIRYHPDPPMPKSDEVCVSVLQETLDEVLVVEWAVQHPENPPRHYEMRHYPFKLLKLVPLSVSTTCLTACVVTPAASWMPRILMLDAFEQTVKEMREALGGLSQAQGQGAEITRSVRDEVWKQAFAALKPCLHSLLGDVLPMLPTTGWPCAKSEKMPPAVFTEDPLSSLSESLDEGGALLMRNFTVALNFTRLSRGWKAWDSKDGKQVLRHKLAGAVQASTMIREVHPMLFALILRSGDFKRSADPSITELREVQTLGADCTIWYQRSNLSDWLKPRDCVYASALADVSKDGVVVLEWGLEDSTAHCPLGQGVIRTRPFFLWDLQRKGSDTHCTVTAILQPGGLPGSQLFRRWMDRHVSAQLWADLHELSTLFLQEEGLKLAKEVKEMVGKEFVTSLSKELTAMQRAFMTDSSREFVAFGGNTTCSPDA